MPAPEPSVTTEEDDPEEDDPEEDDAEESPNDSTDASEPTTPSPIGE